MTAKVVTLYKPSQLSYLKLAHLHIQHKSLKKKRKGATKPTLRLVSERKLDADQPR